MSGYHTFPDADASKHEDDAVTSAGARLWGIRCVTCVSAMAEGYDIGVMAGVLVLAKAEFELTALLVALLMGLFGWAVAIGAILGGPLADMFGRKVGLFVTYLLLVSGVVIMTIATNPGVLIAGRSLQGMSVGAAFCVVGTYMSELSPSKQRGIFVSLEPIFLNVGIFAGFGANYFLLGTTGSASTDWRLMISLGAVLPTCCLVALCLPCIPESPRWLHISGRTQEAVSIMERILPPEETAKIQAHWQLQQAESMASWSEVILPSHDLDKRALKQAVGVAVVQMASGITAILAYMDSILSKTVSHREAFLAMMFVATAKLLVLLAAVLLLDTVGRRRMLLLSSGLMSLALAVLALLFQARVPTLAIVAATALVISSFSLGLGGGAYVLISEVFSNRCRAKGTALAFFASRVVNGGVLFCFPLVAASLSTGGSFFIFSAFTGLGFVFMYYNVEEMKGLTLEEACTRQNAISDQAT
mmetsp:Transcript_94028/g.166522  ORF Transcript_94028/g.166522 Transcript_94028/m.166522 type:complete len:474 (+) Transcript_94028:98-1519(+)